MPTEDSVGATPRGEKFEIEDLDDVDDAARYVKVALQRKLEVGEDGPTTVSIPIIEVDSRD